MNAAEDDWERRFATAWARAEGMPPQELVQTLDAELDRQSKAGEDRILHDEAQAFLALTYGAQGRAVEAAGLALSALSLHLSCCHRSASRNVAALLEKTWD